MQPRRNWQIWTWFDTRPGPMPGTDLICVRLPSDQPMTGADANMAQAI